MGGKRRKHTLTGLYKCLRSGATVKYLFSSTSSSCSSSVDGTSRGSGVSTGSSTTGLLKERQRGGSLKNKRERTNVGAGEGVEDA